MADTGSLHADTDRLAQLERRIAKIEDLENIRELRNRYHQYVNNDKFSSFPELFTEDAVMKYGELATWVGVDSIDGFFRRLPEQTPFIKHFIHNHMVSIDGDVGQGESYFEAKYAAQGRSFRVGGRYLDEYRRVNGRWLFSSLIVEFFFHLPFEKGWEGEEKCMDHIDSIVQEDVA
jgi:hypothetical protein